MFAWCYGLCGAFVDLPMVNSTWTRNHIKALWKLQPVIHTVFPPCDTRSLQVGQPEHPEAMILVNIFEGFALASYLRRLM